MLPTLAPSSDIAFTPSVKAIQTARGSRPAYAKLEARGGFRTGIDPRLTDALAAADSVFLGTANADGQPYIQHRGGPPGFIRVLDEHTLGFAEYAGNRQYITAGNLADNPRAFLFLIDYMHRSRIKLWGQARLETDPDLVARLMPDGYEAHPEGAILFTIAAWDINCPQHIPQKLDATLVTAALAERDRAIERLQAENAALRAAAHT